MSRFVRILLILEWKYYFVKGKREEQSNIFGACSSEVTLSHLLY